jgi:hypothetical protein
LNQCRSTAKSSNQCLSKLRAPAWSPTCGASLQGRNTRHIKRLSPSDTVFILYYAAQQAIQAKITCGPGQTFEREADRLFADILKGAVDKHLRRAYKIGTAHIAVARAAAARAARARIELAQQ